MAAPGQLRRLGAQTIMTAITEKITRVQNLLEGWIGAVMFPCLLYLASRVLLVWTSGLHWILGAIVSAFLAILVGVLFIGLNETFFRRYPTRVVVSLFVSIALLAASVCSAWSYILLSKGLASYTSSKEMHPGVFADFYLWQLIDMIPGFKIWETLGIQAPVKANDPVASLPILIFRVCVVLPLLAVVKKWYDIAKERRKACNDS